MKNAFRFLAMLPVLFGVLSLASCGKDPDNGIPAPSSLRATPITSTSATLLWGGDNADNWEVQFADATEVIKVTTKRHQVVGLTPLTTYKWKVRAVKGGAFSAWVESEFKTATDNPFPPKNLKVEAAGDKAQLSWSVDGTNDSYEVKVGTAAAVTTTTTSHLAEGLVPETDYDWQVRAKKGENYSEWVNGPEIRTINLPTPTNLRIETTSYYGVFYWDGEAPEWEIAWNYINPNLGGSVPSQTGKFAYPGTVVQGFEPGEKFTWRVRAKSGTTYGEWSEYSEEVIIPDYPAGPTLTETGVTVTFKGDTWNAGGFTGQIIANDYGNYVMGVISKEPVPDGQSLEPPYMVLTLPAVSSGSYAGEELIEESETVGSLCDYFETEGFDNGEGANSADWWFEIGNLEIYSFGTASDGYMYSSGYAEVVLFNAYQASLDEDTEADYHLVDHAVVKVEWANMYIETTDTRAMDGSEHIGYVKPTTRFSSSRANRIPDMKELKAAARK